MYKHDISSFLKRVRMQRGFSQTQLAKDSGVSRATIIRIEKGERTPTYETLRTLLEKLGVDPVELSNHFMSNEEVEIYDLLNRLDGHVKDEQLKEANEFVLQLEKNVTFMEKSLNRQLVLFTKARICSKAGKEAQETLGLLYEAIAINIPNYTDEMIPEYFLSSRDLWIINLMASTHFRSKNLEKAIAIMTALKENFDEICIDENLKGKHYPSIMYNLSKYLGLSGRYDEAITFCDIGIDVCRQTNYLSRLPELTYNKAYCLYHLGQKAESEKIFRETYYTFKLYGRDDKAAHVKSHVLEKTDMAFDVT